MRAVAAVAPVHSPAAAAPLVRRLALRESLASGPYRTTIRCLVALCLTLSTLLTLWTLLTLSTTLLLLLQTLLPLALRTGLCACVAAL
jgi:hypothetical protein